MTGEDESRHELSAGYVLGLLSHSERTEFERHLETCRRCERDVLEFSVLPGLLARVDPIELTGANPNVSEQTIAAASKDKEQLMTSRRRWRTSAAVIALSAAVWAGVAFFQRDSTPEFGGPAVELALDQDSGVTGKVVVKDRGWGSRVEIDLFDLPHRPDYRLWAVGTGGEWDVAASWEYAPSGTCRVVGATRLHPEEIDRLVVTSLDKSDELAAAR